MAKQVQLKQNGVEVYPQTITQAIADTSRNKLLSTIIGELYSGITTETNDRIAAINALDREAITEAGKYIVSVSETDGVVSATTKQVEASEVKNESSVVAISGQTTVQGALNALAEAAAAITITNEDGTINVTPSAAGTDINVNIKSGDAILSKSAGSGITSTLNLVKITEDLPATVKERYELQGISGAKIGEDIDIYKDSSLVSITYITDPSDAHYQNLKYVYIDASGVTQTTYVDMSSLVLEAEFASGVTVTNHVVHGVVDSTSEKDSQETPVDFLTVGAGGFKVSGIKDEIDRKINALDAGVSGSSNSVAVEIAEVDGKLTDVTLSVTDASVAFDDATSGLTITGANTDIVTKQGAEAIKAYVDAKSGALDSHVSAQTEDEFIKFEVTQSDGALSSAGITGITKNVADATASNKGLAEAYNVKTYVDGEIDALNADVSAKTTDEFITIQVVEQSGVVTSVAVSDTTQALASADASHKGLAEASDVKGYVDSAITKTAIVASADITPTESATGTTLAINFANGVVSGSTLAVKSGDVFAWGVTTDPSKDKSVADFTWPTA